MSICDNCGTHTANDSKHCPNCDKIIGMKNLQLNSAQNQSTYQMSP